MITDATSAGSTSTPTSALTMPGPGGVLGKDEFLKLLVAQMRHQDPLSPMKADELAVQLAQFSTVEQLIQLNETMSNQTGMQDAVIEALNGNSALTAIGRTVVALGDAVHVPAEGEVPDVHFVVGGAGGAGTIRIYDENGDEIGSRELGFLAAGRQSVGLGDLAEDLPPGVYTYAVEVSTAEGEVVPVQTFTVGRVDGVRYGSTGPVLTAGPLEIPIGGIVEIVAGNSPTQE